MSKYRHFFNQNPIIFNAIQSGLLMGAGDAISQVFIEKTPLKDYNYSRTARFASVGCFVVGPILHKWYSFLHVKLQAAKYKQIKKVALDQCCFAPGFIVLVLTSFGAVEQKSVQNIKADIAKNYFDVLTVNYSLWPFAQAINFSFVPLQYQVLFAQFVAVFWNTYLSWKTQKGP